MVTEIPVEVLWDIENCNFSTQKYDAAKFHKHLTTELRKEVKGLKGEHFAPKFHFKLFYHEKAAEGLKPLVTVFDQMGAQAITTPSAKKGFSPPGILCELCFKLCHY